MGTGVEEFDTASDRAGAAAGDERRDAETTARGEQYDVPSGLEGAPFHRVRDAWAEARLRCDPELPELADALRGLARHARAKGIAVAEVLKALDAVIRPERGGEAALDWDHQREIAGRIAIRSFYHDD